MPPPPARLLKQRRRRTLPLPTCHRGCCSDTSLACEASAHHPLSAPTHQIQHLLQSTPRPSAHPTQLPRRLQGWQRARRARARARQQPARRPHRGRPLLCFSAAMGGRAIDATTATPAWRLGAPCPQPCVHDVRGDAAPAPQTGCQWQSPHHRMRTTCVMAPACRPRFATYIE